MPEVVLIDGVQVDVDRATVSLRDRSVSHGDTVFEVLRAKNGRAFALEEHLGRLQRSAAIVGRVFPCSIGKLASEVQFAVAQSAYAAAHIRVLLTRGEGPDGLSIDRVRGGQRVVWVREISTISSTAIERGIRACAIEHTVGGIAAELARAKTGNYLAKVIALSRAQRRGFDDALLVDDRDRVWEATAANVFARFGRELATPPTTGPILAGVTRALVMDLAAPSYAIRERELRWPELLTADEVFVTSTIREVVSVVEIEDHCVGDGQPGRAAAEVLAAIRARY